MRGRLGGWLIVGGGVLVTVAVWMYVDGQGVGFGAANASGFLIGGALALFAFGAIVLCAVGPDPLHGVPVRVGLGLLAAGQLSLLILEIVLAASTSNPIPNAPLLRLLYLVSGFAGGLGLALSGFGLVRRPGWSRAVGGVLLAGAVALGTVALIATPLRIVIPAHIELLAIGLAIAGNVGIGWLAVRAGRLSPGTAG